MPRLNMAVDHQLGQDEAVRRMKEQFHVVRTEHGDKVTDLEESWEGTRLRFGFTTMGVRIKGTADVGPAQVQLSTDLPLMAMMFKGTIEQQVRERLGAVLA